MYENVKRGDIVTNKYETWIGIFDHSRLQGNCVWMASYEIDVKEFNPNEFGHTYSSAKPASERHKQIFLKAMHDAGYVYDKENFKVCKISDEL